MVHAREYSSDGLLATEIKTLHRLTPAHAKGLIHLKIRTVEDLLRYAPARYINYAEAATSNTIADGEVATLYGKLEKVEVRKSWRTKVNMTEATLSDIGGRIKLVWFNQPYIGKMYPEGTLVRVSGKVTDRQLVNPVIDKVSSLPDTTQSLFFSPPEKGKSDTSPTYVPVYRETKGVSSLFLSELVKKILHMSAFKETEDPLPTHIRKELSLPHFREAVIYSHFPRNDKDILTAQKRFLFEEMLAIQLRVEIERAKAKQSVSYTIGKVDLEAFFTLHNFTPTGAQKRALEAILGDLQRGGRERNHSQSYPMQRLLEGDVGSGKTLVAAAASYAVILEKRDQKKFGTPLQVAYLAPTEVLAYQQFEGFINLLSHTGIEIGYLSGTKALKFPSKLDPTKPTKVSRAQLLKWVQEGKISMLVGTHAITKKSVEFRDLALVIIDEQHRFGINSRKELAHKRGDKRPEIPHLLSMTATPIPRTLALALFGDLDLTVIDELPAGRQKITTCLAHEKKRDEVYNQMEKEIEEGRQVFVICTRIENSEDDQSNTVPQSKRRTVTDEVKALQKRFPHFVIQGMNSRLKTEEKERIMNDFQNNKINILVSTSVIEVGINVPNASMMIIENAEVFGLSQLHQLRGRIGRGKHASTCYLFTAGESEKTLKRLTQFAQTDSGFTLAELDLKERGAGSLVSSNQSGLSDIAMEALKNMKLVEIAKKYAREIVEHDPTLENFPELQEKVTRLEHLHLE